MSYEHLIYETKGRTALIKINRPKVYNALTTAGKLEIIQAVREANRDGGIRSIILTGEGNAFCTGQDLNDRSVQAGQRPVDLGMTLQTEWNPLVASLRESKKIIIGAVNGVCAGAGLSVAMACDLIVAKPGVKFVSGFSKLGLCPDAGSSFVFTRALGAKKALEFFLLNAPMLSEDLERAGLVNKVSEDVIGESLKITETLNAMAPQAVEIIKKNVQWGQESSFNTVIDRETASQRFLGNSADYQEGLKAFFEKRAPNFKGKRGSYYERTKFDRRRTKTHRRHSKWQNFHQR